MANLSRQDNIFPGHKSSILEPLLVRCYAMCSVPESYIPGARIINHKFVCNIELHSMKCIP